MHNANAAQVKSKRLFCTHKGVHVSTWSELHGGLQAQRHISKSLWRMDEYRAILKAGRGESDGESIAEGQRLNLARAEARVKTNCRAVGICTY
jgi:hypothetical protein